MAALSRHASAYQPATPSLGGKPAAIILDDADLDLAAIGQNLFSGRSSRSGSGTGSPNADQNLKTLYA